MPEGQTSLGALYDRVGSLERGQERCNLRWESMTSLEQKVDALRMDQAAMNGSIKTWGVIISGILVVASIVTPIILT